jgi:hypothetical protein
MPPDKDIMMNHFLWGALAATALTAAVFFLKFWRQTHDRLFVMFSGAFAVLALNWIVLAVMRTSDETSYLVYLIRLLAFVLIIIAVIDKNRHPS